MKGGSAVCACWAVTVLACCCAAADSGREKPENMAPERIETAVDLMLGYADRTGLTSARPQRRYLWTDAFAVCNFLGLERATGDQLHRELALRLVDRVHQVLGRHRDDDPRTGWLSGLAGDEGAEHPTRGGLRIGKPLPERAAGDPLDPRLEWDRDGQYFHYLTRWMHALDRVARATRESRFNLWARELAEAAHRGFVHRADADRAARMYWKMSIDLSRPLVPSMGQHDPLDGFVTDLELRATRAELAAAGAARVGGPELTEEVRSFAAMLAGRDWTTDDPLGLGGLLMDALRLQRLARSGRPEDRALSTDLPGDLLRSALAGLRDYAGEGDLERPASMRLAFRELGLAIGLQAVERMAGVPGGGEARTSIETLAGYVPLRDKIVSFWLEPEHQRAGTWTEHRDINEVMLATALAPEGCLD